LVPSSPNPPINKGIESAIDHSIKQEFFNTIGPEPPFDVIAANGNFEPTLPIFHHAANVGFRETGKSYSDNRCHSCLLQYFVGCNVGLQR
jgi:hypothetical protein